MAKKRKVKKASAFSLYYTRIKEFTTNKTTHVSLGVLLLFLAIGLLTASLSFLSNWQQDFSLSNLSFSELLAHPQEKANNWFGNFGFAIAYTFVYKYFGIGTILVAGYLLLLAVRIAFQAKWANLLIALRQVAFFTLFIGVSISYFSSGYSVYGGGIGYYTNQWLSHILGTLGTGLFLFFVLATYFVIRFKLTPEKISTYINTKFSRVKKEFKSKNISEHLATEPFEQSAQPEPDPVLEPTPQPTPEPIAEVNFDNNTATEKPEPTPVSEPPQHEEVEQVGDLEVTVKKEEEAVSESEINKKVKEFGEYDPTLELSRFKLPTLDLLNDYGQSNITIDQDELEANKNRIVETLNNYKIEISKIKATIGPTVTLYEIVPAAGVRISKIKNLEDDIALSLSALGIRIIAPIPGRGTIGIEVPNKKPQMVSMRNVLASEKYQNSKMELPIALGKTISNETLVTDLAKMPHLLMAGATGQGKSVGLNAILASILYKKHPSAVKFVLVDPKKVELTLFNHIERHYLAKLPDSEEPIITDTSKVVNTLNSLCIEMDQRYELLKNAYVRNIKEYNQKFVQRKLNPENGHRFLPYIVLVIDEFADLIMTAGKEVETPIARLAQLARAIGIHLIIATQRPSVNVITGIIKANFPARIAFRVTSKIDSRTILDAGGADQLIGKGDMLFNSGGDLIRVQCAFLDTPEVEKICDYIGGQQGYSNAYELPEYVGEEGGSSVDGLDPSDRDALFVDAARIIVQHQQGSASLLQRKLKLGYNRAGRIVDQLEAAGIIGPFEGSKARQVLVPDEAALNQILNNNS